MPAHHVWRQIPNFRTINIFITSCKHLKTNIVELKGTVIHVDHSDIVIFIPQIAKLPAIITETDCY